MAIARRGAALLLLGSVLLAPAVASAQPQPRASQAARDHVRAGMAYAERGKWEDALREFEEAYALEPQPLRLFDVAQARFKTNRFRAAAEAYAKLVDSPALSAEQHDRVRAGLVAAREKIARVRVSVTNARAGDVVSIDGVAVARETTVEVDPGHHVARVVREGEASDVAFDVEPGAMTTVTIVAPSKEPSTAPSPDPPRVEKKRGVPTMAWVLGGTSLAAFAVAGYAGYVGLAKYERIKEDPCATTKTCGRAEFNAMKTHLVIADVMAGVGVVSAGAAIAIWLLSRRSAEPEKRAVKVMPHLLGGSTLTITF